MSVFELNVAGGYFRLLNDSAEVVLDTRNKVFRTTDVIQGQLALAARATPLNVTNTYSLGSCNANSDFLSGYAKFSYGSDSYHGVTAGPWFYLSGSLVQMWSGGGFGATSAAVYSFMISGGTVSLEEQLGVPEYKNSVGQSFSYAAVTIDYELWCGTFV